jgi:hypothetical protein
MNIQPGGEEPDESAQVANVGRLSPNKNTKKSLGQ